MLPLGSIFLYFLLAARAFVATFTRMRGLIITIGILSVFTAAQARESNLKLHFEQALNNPDIQSKLGKDIQYSFAGSPTPTFKKDFGEAVISKKTNAFNKSEVRACEKAFLSAVLALRDQARKHGANAIVEIRSFYKDRPLAAENQYECSAGAFIAAVTLKGRFVSMEESN